MARQHRYTRGLASPSWAPALGAIALAAQWVSAQAAPAFPNQETICSFNAAREQQRAASAQNFGTPVVSQMLVNGALVWTAGANNVAPTLKPGDTVTLNGSGFGQGTNIDFSKIMIGNARVLETDLVMYEQKLDIISTANYETGVVRSSWPKDVLAWSDTQVQFRVPPHASKGPLKLQVQKRTGYNNSLTKSGPHNIIDAQVYRVPAPANPNCDVVSTLSEQTKAITPIEVAVSNPSFAAMVKLGRQMFWSYDYNLGLSHKFKNLDWDKILNYKTTDPYTRKAADPLALFGAYKINPSEVPAEAYTDVYFKPYPQTNPTPGLLALGPQLTEGNTSSTGWVGYRKAESNHPLLGKGAWAGFNCASCHGYRISYDKGGSTVTKVFPGLPNPGWTMKWAVLGDKIGQTTANFAYISEMEEGPSWNPGSKKVDKTALLYHMPAGAAEATITRTAHEGTLYDNDYIFSPIAIPNVTFHLPIRRSLSHTESYVGFEGSYIHAQEPDGAMGSTDANSLKALTAYMSTLDENDDDLRNAGMFRWLKSNGKLAQTGGTGTTEGSFVQNGWKAYPGVSGAVAQGKLTYDQNCASCHSDKVGANTNERMIPLNQVGRFFAPTDFQVKQQSIRATYLRDLYWVTSRGLLSDGHVRNLEDLVHPDRCAEGTALYNQYYTLHAPVRPAPGTADQPTPVPDLNRKGDVFRVPKAKQINIFDVTSPARNLFVERHKYFTVPSFDANNYYWDFQKMRKEFGPEMGASGPIGMPASPHPWCAKSSSEVSNLVQYLLTL
ncbi:MAG: c-type cytochrome [Aquabacterium sp.]|uniref:IPT/TIG domain-containing protein n=1 Tax=Aquabacterium sp. TaxID=1872578 RepID=UPI0025BEAD94|nr:IPT/TIG domain-containing protein [Aquabacterium sp.]MBI5927508.1 c-type cytochrome [Aquabacterium sp.]